MELLEKWRWRVVAGSRYRLLAGAEPRAVALLVHGADGSYRALEEHLGGWLMERGFAVVTVVSDDFEDVAGERKAWGSRARAYFAAVLAQIAAEYPHASRQPGLSVGYSRGCQWLPEQLDGPVVFATFLMLSGVPPVGWLAGRQVPAGACFTLLTGPDDPARDAVVKCYGALQRRGCSARLVVTGKGGHELPAQARLQELVAQSLALRELVTPGEAEAETGA